MAHAKFNPNCHICRAGKPQRSRASDKKRQRSKQRLADGDLDDSEGRDTLVFGDRTTGDYLLQRRSEVQNAMSIGDTENPSSGSTAAAAFDDYPNANCAAVFFDVGTDWNTCSPRAGRSTDETELAAQQFKGTEPIIVFYSDGAPELKRAMLELHVMNPNSSPARPDRNGMAEGWIKKSKGTTRCSMI
jgi:hypothetical protein